MNGSEPEWYAPPVLTNCISQHAEYLGEGGMIFTIPHIIFVGMSHSGLSSCST